MTATVNTTTAPDRRDDHHHLCAAKGVARRALFGAGAALAALPVVPALAVPSLHPDTDLFRACDDHAKAFKAFNLYEEEDATREALWMAYSDACGRIDEAEPQTFAGMVAKARAAKLQALDPDGDDSPEGCPAENWAWDLVNDLIRMADAVTTAGGAA